MKFRLTVVALLPLVNLLPAADPSPETAVSNASPEALFKRVCSYDDNCFSVTGFSAGRYVRYWQLSPSRLLRTGGTKSTPRGSADSV